MTDELALDVRGLTKNFGAVHALTGLDLRVATGSVAGFLGPNGSGKSTTIRILLGLLRADGGSATLLGGDPWRDAVALHRRVAYVAGDVTLWPNLTGGQAIDILGALRGDLDRTRIDRYLQLFELDPSKKARSYSKGNRQKVALVAALSSHAELLILDEPTIGLDPLMEGVFTNCITELKDEGRSVLLSSHIFSEVEKLCDTVTIIRAGRTVESGTLTELRHLHRSTITVTLDGDPTVISTVDGVHDFAAVGQRVSFSVTESALPRVMAALAPHAPRGLISSPPSLEELFLRHYAAQHDGALADAEVT
ncbi:ABC transporter ATP-binding protein [Cryobacterium psychrophilum]|uniref:ABC transporter ATP-binding protein n=1 Tax=Cryobacterium psychrophilum TaxID=41988 RepID=A0A4Y8KT61_9MICO|nr:ABC transporter ATP-binding protein [Cryobacterium psychrophilum]TDW29066.1 ABC-2 type transport system ATP-binding protein [Cryobacterium psychrophilum]TFD79722.1 ABC transporter ATP-binding protein [Cryobacterium psychrophilum]